MQRRVFFKPIFKSDYSCLCDSGFGDPLQRSLKDDTRVIDNVGVIIRQNKRIFGLNHRTKNEYFKTSATTRNSSEIKNCKEKLKRTLF